MPHITAIFLGFTEVCYKTLELSSYKCVFDSLIFLFPQRGFSPFAYKRGHLLHLKWMGFPWYLRKARQQEPQYIPSCNVMPSSQLPPPRRLKYSGKYPQRRPRGPVEWERCWKQVAGKCHQVSVTWQQSRAAGVCHLPPFFAALLLPIAALTFLLAYTKTFFLQEEQAIRLHESSTQKPRTCSPSSLLEFCHEWPDHDEVSTWNKMEMEIMNFYALEQVINCSQLML